MNKEAFYSAVGNPAQVSPALVEQLSATLRQFPYFHAGWMLLARGLADMGSVHFAGGLRKAAIHVWDRGALYWLVNNRLDKLPAAGGGEEGPANRPAGGCEALAEPRAATRPQEVFAPITPAEAEVSIGDELGLGQPGGAEQAYHIEDVDSHFRRPDERYSFTDWLEYTAQLQAVTAEESREAHRGQDLIDKFLSHGDDHIVPRPGAPRPDDGDARRMEEESVRENDDILTETLASIYLKQKQYAKAINIFKKLSLKYPEKSSYFAARISDIENNKT